MIPYKNATCLILDKRINNLPKIKNQAQALNINIDFFICGSGDQNVEYDHVDINEIPHRYQHSINYPSWYTRPNAYNAWMCHHKIMKRAIEKGQEHLLILEDDIIFELDFIKILENTVPFLNNNQWDIIYFGWYSNDHLHPTDNPNVYRMIGGAGFHGILLTRHIMEMLVESDPLGPYDWIVGTYITPYYNCYAIYPSIITQESGYSYIEDGILTKPDRNHK